MRNFKYIYDGTEMMKMERDFVLREIGNMEVWEWGVAVLEGWGAECRSSSVYCLVGV